MTTMQALGRSLARSSSRSNLARHLTQIREVANANPIVIRCKSSLAAATAAYDQTVETFPSIVIGPNKTIEPQGSFAEAQAQFLDPDSSAVQELADKLLATNMGVVAHYYMDVELQGVLTAVKRLDPALESRIGIADSLAMGDFAVQMCRTHSDLRAVACLGVDFMAESVQAILERQGHSNVPVLRASANKIGCSLAESAERESYRAWLEVARAQRDPALHVVYINTSLETKAVSTSIVPTITCTSSNVLQTLLQASSQVGPELKVFYGPDTYMGENLVSLLDAIAQSWDDERIARDLHASHSRESIRNLRDRMDVYPHGNCVVHHMFGASVVEAVKRNYDDAYVTAHLEVPGEMFQIAMDKSLEGRGVVGSTSDILKFITHKVDQAARGEIEEKRLKFILGTEAGMVTSIVKSVQDILDRTKSNDVEAEIVFPVSSEAVMGVDDDDVASTNLSVVPGVSGGEGCSTAGGCATCPYMKMNDLDALQDVIDMVGRTQAQGGSPKDDMILQGHLPPNRLSGKQINGVDATDLGTQPIMYMREFMKNKTISEELLNKVRNAS